MAIENNTAKCDTLIKVKVDCVDCGATFLNGSSHICVVIGGTAANTFNLVVGVPVLGGTKVVTYSASSAAASCTASTGAPDGVVETAWDKI